MKKFIAVFLSLVMIFSFAVPSFAYQPGSSDDELEALNNIEYYTYWIWSDFTDKLEELKTWDYNSLQQLLDINDYTRSIYNELSALREAFVGDTVWLRPFADTLLSSLDTIDSNVSVLYEDLHALREVLADPDDLSLKESQKANLEFIEDNFFSPGSSSSVDLNKLGSLVDFSSSFSESFDFSSYGSGSPLSQMGEGSDFMSWFTDETGLDMDPDFSGGSGGGDFPDPGPDEPDPIPETTATPTISYNESTFTVSASGNGTVILYVDGTDVSNPYIFTQGESSVTYVVTATAQETDKFISETARLVVTVPALDSDPDEPDPTPETTAIPTISYNESTFTVSASGNGTVILYVDGVVVSNPYTFTQTESSVTYVVTATAQESDKLISETARLDVIVDGLPVVPSFPSEPSSYSLLSTYRSDTVFTAPEDGWYQFEAYGSSGASGRSLSYSSSSTQIRNPRSVTGGGGGGGAFSASRVKLNQGDSVIISILTDVSVRINFQSSLESYSSITVDYAGYGTNGVLNSSGAFKAGAGGSGGVASGGNYSNINGYSGRNGSTSSTSTPASIAVGGAPAVSGGNKGASSPAPPAFTSGYHSVAPNSGLDAFVKVYRGNTNIVSSSYSLRSPSFDSPSSSSSVTSYYSRRNNSFFYLLSGGAK